MMAIQESYQELQQEGSDLKYCNNNTIVQFFEQLGLKMPWTSMTRLILGRRQR